MSGLLTRQGYSSTAAQYRLTSSLPNSDYRSMSETNFLGRLEILQKYDYKCIRCGVETGRIHDGVNVPLCSHCFDTWAKKYPYAAMSVLINLKAKYIETHG